MLFFCDGEGADYEQVVAVQDRASGLRAVIAIHSTQRGPAFGGIRRAVYANEDAALADATRLAAAMTGKCALAGLPAGGAKTVVFDGPELERAAAYEALGRAVESLGGRYICGPDMGTGPEELAALRHGTSYVNPAGNDAGASTAAGVLAGLRGMLRVIDGREQLDGRRYVIQGFGSVGLALARALVDAGAEISGHDVDERALGVAERAGVRPLEGGAVLTTPCDVFMPCAHGGVIDGDVAAHAPWGAVCGSANNQLAGADVGEVLHARGIPWAPDVVVNAGAVIEGVLTMSSGQSHEVRARVDEAIEAIGETCESVLREAAQRGLSPGRVTRERIRECLA